MIKSLNSLTEEEKKNFFDWANQLDSNFCYTKDYILNEPCNHGENYWIFLENSRCWGSLGVITREISETDTAYIAFIFAPKECSEKFSLLLNHAMQFLSQHHPKVIKIGLSHLVSHLHQIVIDQGFRQSDRSLLLKFDENKRDLLNDNLQIRLQPLSEEMFDLYQSIQHSSFKTTPNASLISIEEINKFYRQYSNQSGFIGIAYNNDNEAIGIYQVEKRSDTYCIEALGVNPTYQKRGFGKQILTALIKLLDNSTIKLMVMESNKRAFNLYLACGFIKESTISTWYLK